MRMSNLEELNAEIRIVGGQLNNLCDADDTTLMAGEVEVLQDFLKE